MQKLKFISYGESLVDFLPSERGQLRNVSSFTKALGGAPTNLAVGLARMEEDVALLGIVGDDEFGFFIKEELVREGVDSTYVATTKAAKTGITFITLNEDGDRSFLFFREPSADQTITPESISTEVFNERDVMTIGSNLLTTDSTREATHFAVKMAREKGLKIAMDVNYRAHLWSAPELARKEIKSILNFVNLVKVNEEEFEFLAEGKSSVDFFNLFPCEALVITKAEKGATVICERFEVSASALEVDVVDTTGAGDGFISALLSTISRVEITGSFDTRLLEMNESQWAECLSFACNAGSKVCTKFGATAGLLHRKN